MRFHYLVRWPFNYSDYAFFLRLLIGIVSGSLQVDSWVVCHLLGVCLKEGIVVGVGWIVVEGKSCHSLLFVAEGMPNHSAFLTSLRPILTFASLSIWSNVFFVLAHVRHASCISKSIICTLFESNALESFEYLFDWDPTVGSLKAAKELEDAIYLSGGQRSRNLGERTSFEYLLSLRLRSSQV